MTYYYYFIIIIVTIIIIIIIIIILSSSSSSSSSSSPLFWLIFDRCVLFVFKAFNNCFEVTYMPIMPILNVYTPANICSNATIETLEKGVKYVQS